MVHAHSVIYVIRQAGGRKVPDRRKKTRFSVLPYTGDFEGAHL
jgi:hypothetical protein